MDFFGYIFPKERTAFEELHSIKTELENGKLDDYKGLLLLLSKNKTDNVLIEEFNTLFESSLMKLMSSSKQLKTLEFMLKLVSKGLLSDGLLNKLLAVDIQNDEHTESLFITILKSSSLRVDETNIDTFTANDFPLFKKTLPYHFHNESMIRISGMII